MKLSIVTTLYRSAPYVEEFHRRASAAARTLVEDDYEIVMVNDGSPDNALELAVKLTEQDQHVVVVDLSRNFGHHKAMMTGLAHATGEQVFLIDIDLEEEPEWLVDFVEQMEQEKCDVVYGVQQQRKGRLFERWSGELFWRAFRSISGLPVPKNLVTARIMSRRYVDALLLHQEREVFMAGLLYITGFVQKERVVTKLSTSPSTYSLRARVSLALNAILSFTSSPLVWIFYAGLLISTCSALYVVYLLLQKIALNQFVSGWASLIASTWLLGGLMILFISVIGMYVSKVFNEVKQRPYSIVRALYKNRKM